jgi:hypothetical protein
MGCLELAPESNCWIKPHNKILNLDAVALLTVVTRMCRSGREECRKGDGPPAGKPFCSSWQQQRDTPASAGNAGCSLLLRQGVTAGTHLLT